VEGKLCLLDVSMEMLEMSEAIRCALLCMLHVVEGKLCSLEVLEVLAVLAVPDVMQRTRHGDGGGCRTCQLINGKGVKEVNGENCDRK